MDLICSRYPGTKPSDYLKVKDNYTAFQLDAALAIQGNQRETLIRQYEQRVIHFYILQVAKAMGAKGVPSKPPKPPNLQVRRKDELPTIQEVLAQFGTTGAVINYGRS